jgi:CRISPR system Cascade subunit CasB
VDVVTAQHVDEFIDALAELDAGDRARLKRNAGKPIAESRGAMAVFFREIPYAVPRQQQELYFLIATLFPLTGSTAAGDLGASLRAVRTDANGAGLDRRVETLLDADSDQLRFRLRRAVSVIAAARGSINWRLLLRDVLRWNNSDRGVQRRWAQSYFS